MDFTPKKYHTLALFVKNPRLILTKRQLLERLWDIDGDFVDEHTLATIISPLNGVLALLEQKQIALSVDCPENLTVAHDSRLLPTRLMTASLREIPPSAAGCYISAGRDFINAL